MPDILPRISPAPTPEPPVEPETEASESAVPEKITSIKQETVLGEDEENLLLLLDEYADYPKGYQRERAAYSVNAHDLANSSATLKRVDPLLKQLPGMDSSVKFGDQNTGMVMNPKNIRSFLENPEGSLEALNKQRSDRGMEPLKKEELGAAVIRVLNFNTGQRNLFLTFSRPVIAEIEAIVGQYLNRQIGETSQIYRSKIERLSAEGYIKTQKIIDLVTKVFIEDKADSISSLT